MSNLWAHTIDIASTALAVLIAVVTFNLPIAHDFIFGANPLPLSTQQQSTLQTLLEIHHPSSATTTSPAILTPVVRAPGPTIYVRKVYTGLTAHRTVSEVATSTLDAITLDPRGGEGLFTKEEAVTVARKLGFTTGFDEALVGQRFDISEDAAKNTGSGMAWFISGQDYHASTSYCPPQGGSFSNEIILSFEMNEASGNVYAKTLCQPVIFD